LELFSPFGKITSTILKENKFAKNATNSVKSSYCGIVIFENREDANKAIDVLNGKEINGSKLLV